MIEPRVLALWLVYIGAGTISYGVAYFLRQIIKGIGISVFATGFVAAIPSAVGWPACSPPAGSAIVRRRNDFYAALSS
jgi:hypothetical protein